MASRSTLGLDTAWQLCETSHVSDLNCVCAVGFQIVVASVPGSALVSVKLLSHVQKNCYSAAANVFMKQAALVWCTLRFYTIASPQPRPRFDLLALPAPSFCTFAWVLFLFFLFFPSSSMASSHIQRAA